MQILKIILPIYILMLITTISFVFPNNELEKRIAVSLTCVLVAVLMQVLVDEKVPRQVFFNFMNAASQSAFVVLLQSMLISLLLQKLHVNDQSDAAERIRRGVLVQYPLLQVFILLDLYLFQVEELKFSCVISLLWTFGGISYIIYVFLTQDRSSK